MEIVSNSRFLDVDTSHIFIRSMTNTSSARRSYDLICPHTPLGQNLRFHIARGIKLPSQPSLISRSSLLPFGFANIGAQLKKPWKQICQVPIFSDTAEKYTALMEEHTTLPQQEWRQWFFTLNASKRPFISIRFAHSKPVAFTLPDRKYPDIFLQKNCLSLMYK